MRVVILQRLTLTSQGTLGTLAIDGQVFHTLELPWRNNAAMISSIPAGQYKCHMTYSPRFKRKLYEIFGVPARSAIRIHAANYAGDKSLGFRSDLNGCIALGLGVQNVSQLMLTNSRAAMSKFHSLMNNEDFVLEVRNS